MRQLKISISEENLGGLVSRQLINHFPDNEVVDHERLKHCISSALLRIRKCFDPVRLKYFGEGDVSYFNHLHGDHYSMFLYLVSNEAYRLKDETLAAKLFLLNKVFFGVDAFYSVQLPEHFLFVHPLGTILGNANYSDYFVVYQGVTVGATTEGIYPSFSEAIILYSNSSIIGHCNVGSNFILAANASLINSNVQAHKIVVGNYPNHSILENKKNLISNYFSF